MLKAWCTWHDTGPTCVQHRPCACGRQPVMQTTAGVPYCIEHAEWTGTHWTPKPEPQPC